MRQGKGQKRRVHDIKDKLRDNKKTQDKETEYRTNRQDKIGQNRQDTEQKRQDKGQKR